ncbi:hypothetical protein [Actinomycetospora aeridis]|uniref:Small secreted domain DUF320 n=1 Tax=Actinomycetospora aeridis TaxID=3129231 RepID=A0ABU8N299_9PSEU
MFRRTAAIVSLSGAGLLAASGLAQADPVVVDDDDPGTVVVNQGDSGLNLLNGLTVPVQACGVEAGIPILSDVLGPDDEAPDATCSVVEDAEDD